MDIDNSDMIVDSTATTGSFSTDIMKAKNANQAENEANVLF